MLGEIDRNFSDERMGVDLSHCGIIKTHRRAVKHTGTELQFKHHLLPLAARKIDQEAMQK